MALEEKAVSATTPHILFTVGRLESRITKSGPDLSSTFEHLHEAVGGTDCPRGFIFRNAGVL